MAGELCLVQSGTSVADERVRRIRAALDAGDRPTAEYHFAELLTDSRECTEHWVRRTVALTPALHRAPPYVVSSVCQDLRQELALHLWERIADRHEMAWERTYWRALSFAQKHVAASYMIQAGYWRHRTVTHPTRGVALSLTDAALAGLEAPDVLSAVEIAEVHGLVRRLPPKERAAVVLRYWQDMREQDIARVLGCTDRTVRTLLRQAREQLAIWYEGPTDAVVAAQVQTSAVSARAGAREPVLG